MDIKKINWSCKEMFWFKSWSSQVKYAVNRVWHLRSQKALKAKLQLCVCKSLVCVVVYHCHLYKKMIEFTSVKACLCLVCIQLAHTAEVCMHICIFYHLLAEKAGLKLYLKNRCHISKLWFWVVLRKSKKSQYNGSDRI